MIAIAKRFDPLSSPCRGSTTDMWEASDLERILFEALVRWTQEKNEYVDWPLWYNWNNVQNGDLKQKNKTLQVLHTVVDD